MSISVDNQTKKVVIGNSCQRLQLFPDSAVLTGSLIWVKFDGENRTTAQFSLTLSLSRSQYPSAVTGDRVYVTGGVVEFGDGETTGNDPLPMEV